MQIFYTLKRTRLTFWSIITVLLFINTFILLHRNEGYKYFPYKSYSQLYVTDSSLYLKDIHFNNDTLNLFLSQKTSGSRYTLSIDDSLTSIPTASADNSLQIPLQKNFHTYKLIPADSNNLAIQIQVDHSQNSSSQYINEFIYSNLPGPQIKVSPYKLWTKGIASFTKMEVDNGLEFLEKNTTALSLNTDSERLMEVCKLMSMLRPNPLGIKASEASLQPPFLQLQMSIQQKINLDCGNYSVMLHYLCCLLKLPNRVITFSGPAGNWQYGVHYFNEIYLREKQQWVLCDGLSNAYMPHDSLRFYNAADVNKMAHTNSFSNKYVYTFANRNIRKARYDSLSYWHWYYNRNNSNLCYLHPGTGIQNGNWNYLKNFYSFDRNFDFYSDVNGNDWAKILIKMSAFYLLIVTGLFYVAWEIKTFKR